MIYELERPNETKASTSRSKNIPIAEIIDKVLSFSIPIKYIITKYRYLKQKEKQVNLLII